MDCFPLNAITGCSAVMNTGVPVIEHAVGVVRVPNLTLSFDVNPTVVAVVAHYYSFRLRRRHTIHFTFDCAQLQRCGFASILRAARRRTQLVTTHAVCSTLCHTRYVCVIRLPRWVLQFRRLHTSTRILRPFALACATLPT